jgi:PIN domain nuclease of toxin-antitoxin system
VILLDTHVVVWVLAAPEQLSPRARSAILHARSTGDRLAYSSISLYEIANSVRRRRLYLNSTIQEFFGAIQAKFEVNSLTAEIAICAAGLPQPFHGDPMDRIIAATAIVGGYTLITHDGRIRDCNLCKTLW